LASSPASISLMKIAVELPIHTRKVSPLGYRHRQPSLLLHHCNEVNFSFLFGSCGDPAYHYML
jgi:hypothetical protein